MANEILQLCAYHESGRVVFAYRAGFFCDGLELSATDYGRGKSVLDGGSDTPLIQQVLSGNHLLVAPESRTRAIEVAQHLMEVYCAGSCTRAYFEQLAEPGSELEIDVPAVDEKAIMAVQKFLTGMNPGHDPSFPSKCMTRILQKLQDHETWKAVQSLAQAAINNDEKPLTRFEIEDTLMAGGMKIKRTAAPGFNVGLGDALRKSAGVVMDEEPRKPAGPLSTTDILLSDFFRNIRTDWTEDEAQAAVKHVKEVMTKYGLK